jgi:uncharacterized protein with PQ loop repeat
MLDLESPPDVLTFAIIGNLLNLAYNIPFVWLIWKNRNSNNISGAFLILRFFGSISWIIYAFLLSDVWVGLSYAVTLISTLFVIYVKCLDRKKKKQIKYLKDTNQNIKTKISYI